VNEHGSEISGPTKGAEFLDLVTVSFSRRTLPRGVSSQDFCIASFRNSLSSLSHLDQLCVLSSLVWGVFLFD